MVYVEEWAEFEYRAKELFMQKPHKTRYTIKYRHGDSEIVLKVTDDVLCLKYKTDQVTDMKLIEKLNNFFLGTMSSNRLEEAVDAANAAVTADDNKEETPEQSQPKTKKQKRKNRKQG